MQSRHTKHHIGCAFLPDETIETFSWQTLKGMNDTNKHRDEGNESCNCSSINFSTHRCCKFHVFSKACEKFGWLIKNHKEFADEFDYCINYIETPKEFKTLEHNIEKKHNMHHNEHFPNVSSTKIMCAPSHFRKCFFSCASTTGDIRLWTHYSRKWSTHKI